MEEMMMNDGQITQQNASLSTDLGYRTDGSLYAGKPDDSAFSSTIANMDKYDYMNMLAESRIVDIAWVH